MHTPQGAFRINRGIVELPDELGQSLGWSEVTADGDDVSERTPVRRATPPDDNARLAD